MSQTVAIVGYGTAAVNAIIALRTSGYEGRIIAFADTDAQPYSPILTSYYAGGTKEYAEVFPWSEAELATFNVEVHASEPVTTLNPAEHTITTAAGTYAYDKCLVCSGATPLRGGFPEAEGFEPYVLRTLEDGARLKAALEADPKPRVLISGTSLVALKVLEACLDQSASATVLGRSEHILKRIALPQVAAGLEAKLAEQGVDLRLSTTATAVAMEDGRAKVAFSDGAQEAYDVVVIAHGVTPNLDFVAPESLAMGKGLLVDDFMRTSDADVFAAGDVAQVNDLVAGAPGIIGLWKESCLQGTCAGQAMAADLLGDPAIAAAYEGGIPNNALIIQRIVMVSGGNTAPMEGGSVDIAETAEGIRACVFDAEGTLRGFNIVCYDDAPGGDTYEDGMHLLRRVMRAYGRKI